MLDGQQWLVFEGSREAGGVWRKLKPSPINEYIPRPVTNYLYDAYQTLKSYVLKNKPRISVRANSQQHKDKVAAKLAELISETNWKRLKEDMNYEYAAACGIAYGTVFKKDYWDNSYLNLARVPRMEQRPVTDPMTGQPTGQIEEIPMVDPLTGAELYDELPLGDLSTAVVEPYRIAMDPLASSMHELRWVMEYSIRPLSWITENYDRQEEGYTGKAQEVVEEKSLSNSLRRFFQLRTSTGVRGNLNGTTGLTTSSSAEMIDNAAVVKEYYERPTQKNPHGRLAVVANNVLLYLGPSPYSGPESSDWHPYSEFRWEIVPGRFWGKSPLDDSAEIQKQINSIDSLIILTRQTMAVPQKLVPQGSMAPGSWTGQPGQEIFARPGPNGEMPQNLPAAGVDAQVFAEREQRVSDLKQITGAIDILKGDRPTGVDSASGMALLYEIGTGKLFPALDRWKYFIESSQKKQLRIIENKYREPRPEFSKMLIAKNKDLTEDQLRNFIGQDLYDNCNVEIEASSSIPKLRAAEHMLLLEIASQGVLNLENPANKQEFLSRFGISGFDSDYTKDVQRAEWENDLLDNLPNTPDNQPIVLDVDNHQVHLAIHAEHMKEPSWLSMPLQVQQAYLQHNMQHEQKLAQQQQQQMIQAAMMGQQAQPNQQPNPMQQQEKVRKGNYTPEKIQKALAPDVFGPTPLLNK